MGWAKKPKKSNRSRNQTETEFKNRLIEPIGLVLVFILYNSWFRFKFRFKNTKTVVSINQSKNKKNTNIILKI